MLLLRRIDCYGQCLLCFLMIISVPVWALYGFLIGLFVLGCWQLLSAVLNTHGYVVNGFRKQIINYWTLAAVILAILFTALILSMCFGVDQMEVGLLVALIASIPLSFYYIYLYTKLIAHMRIKRELAGFTKSKY